MPAAAELVAGALSERRLSSRDKRFRAGVHQDPWVEQEAMAQDLTPENIQALARAIDRAPTPGQKAILQAEMDRLRGLASNLQGPVEKPAPPAGTIPESGMQQLPYDPKEGVGRPAMLAQPRQAQTYSDTPAGYGDMSYTRPPMPAPELPSPSIRQQFQHQFGKFWMPLMDHIEQGARGRNRVGPPTAAEALWDAKMRDFRQGYR